MATAPYQWIKQAQKANEKLTAERNTVNDVYAEYALQNVGQFMPYTSSVASGQARVGSRPYTYAELVYMGQRMFPQETLESLQQQYETQKSQVFTSGKRAGEEQGVSVYINGKYRYTTPSQITQEKIKSLQALSNPEYKSDIVNKFLSDLETKEFDPYTGFNDSKGYVNIQEDTLPQSQEPSSFQPTITLSQQYRPTDTYQISQPEQVVTPVRQVSLPDKYLAQEPDINLTQYTDPNIESNIDPNLTNKIDKYLTN